VAAFNLYPSTRGRELDDIGSNAIQVLDHAPLHRAPIRRVIQRADQVQARVSVSLAIGNLVRVASFPAIRSRLATCIAWVLSKEASISFAGAVSCPSRSSSAMISCYWAIRF